MSIECVFLLGFYENILQVLLPQLSGSNRGGFSVVSTAKGTVRLDGVFNIVSYDSIPKLQGILMSSDFKVNISYFHA